MTELYARIRPGTRYASQDPGQPFEVRLKHHATDGYYWQGGPGGQYRHSDLQLLHAYEEGDELQELPLFAAGEGVQVIRLILDQYEAQAARGGLCSEWFKDWAADIRTRLATIQASAEANEEDDDE